ncbi:Pyruvate carboxylase, partial [Cyphellophora attinorum]
MPPPQRPINNLLIANRGEIAIRILQAVHELPDPQPTTYALYTDTDSTHVSLGRPDHALKLSSAAQYMDIDHLVELVKEHKIDAVHPGYGFLSESAAFSRRMWEEAGCMVVGPGWEVLEQTGDKLRAKQLAMECGVPVLKAMVQRPGMSVPWPILRGRW